MAAYGAGRRVAGEEVDLAGLQALLLSTQRVLAQQEEAKNAAPNPLTVFLTQGMSTLLAGATLLVAGAVWTVSKTIYHLPTIALSAGLAIAANELAHRYKPNASASVEPVLAGSFKVALLVGTTFFTKAALNIFLKASIEHNTKDRKKNDREKLLYGTAVKHLCPLTITLIAAHVYGLKVKTLEGALYTLGLFGLIKVLEKGFTYGVNTPGISWLVNKSYGIST